VPTLTLITDTTADLPMELQRELGIRVVPASAAFEEHAFVDGELPPAAFYARMEAEQRAPRPFGVREELFRKAFAEVLDAAGTVLCLVTPFDVMPTFTTASAAMLTLDRPGIKVANPGVASAGLCSLLAVLGTGVQAGWGLERVLGAIDALEPRCVSLFVPADNAWLERSGRLAMIEDRIGKIEGGAPVVRVGTRVTGVALTDTHNAAIDRAVALAGKRAGEGARLVVTVDHAANPALAETVAAKMCDRWPVERLIVTELSPTIGSQLGPGAVGIGVCPAAE
jgi:DegV family protein with EDD domain